jgi:hypothetical protein
LKKTTPVSLDHLEQQVSHASIDSRSGLLLARYGHHKWPEVVRWIEKHDAIGEDMFIMPQIPRWARTSLDELAELDASEDPLDHLDAASFQESIDNIRAYDEANHHGNGEFTANPNQHYLWHKWAVSAYGGARWWRVHLIVSNAIPSFSQVIVDTIQEDQEEGWFKKKIEQLVWFSKSFGTVEELSTTSLSNFLMKKKSKEKAITGLSIEDRLTTLKDLLNKGLINQGEYDSTVARILEEM